MSKSSIIETVWKLAEPIAEELGLKLWDVRFEKEGASYFLRIIIDKEGGVDINACEAMSRRLDPLLVRRNGPGAGTGLPLHRDPGTESHHRFV